LFVAPRWLRWFNSGGLAEAVSLRGGSRRSLIDAGDPEGDAMATQLASITETRIAEQMGFTEADMERRRRIVGFGSDDMPRITRIREGIVRRAEEYTATFFSYLAGLDEAKDFLRQRELVDLARRLKTDHLHGLVSGQYGVDYATERAKLGLVYNRGGLDMRVFLGAFHHLLRSMGNTIIKSARTPEEGFEDFMSLKKLAFFDIGIITDVMIFQREETINRQQESIRELSTPVLEIREQLLMLPIIGTIDTHRARLLTEGLLHAIRSKRGRVVVMDVTGVGAVDTKVANHLLHTVAASKLMGAHVIITGLSADVAQTLVNLGVDLTRLNTIGDLRSGIEEAERMLGYQVQRGERRSAPAVVVQ
jgi:rsbT co-antagonist protein RsbR